MFAIAKRITQTVLAMAALALVAAQSHGQAPPKKDAAADADEQAALTAFCHGHNGPEFDIRLPFTSDGHVRCLNLVAHTSPDKDCALLPRFPYLLKLVFRANITDAGLAHVSGLKGLKYLELWSDKVTDEGLRHLASLNDLESLTLNTPHIKGAGLKYLAGLPKLANLEVWMNEKEIVRSMVAFPALREIQLKHAVPGADLAPLQRLSHLERLRLFGGTDDDGIKNLAPIKTLHYIDDDVSLTDKGLPYLAELSDLRELTIGANGASEAGLASLRKLKKIEALEIWGKADAILKNVTGWTKLRWVIARGATDDGLRYLEGLPEVTSVRLANAEIGDAGLAHLARIPKLDTLDAQVTRVSDAGMVHLEAMHALKFLDLSDTKITDAGMKHIAKLDRLEALYLGGNQITDAGLVHLLGLSKLGTLNLSQTYVTAKGIQQLVALKNLGLLDVQYTSVSEKAAYKLQRAMKNPPTIRTTPRSILDDNPLHIP
jgi:Leucine-rich repeat (LRR) protein